jgi:integrase
MYWSNGRARADFRCYKDVGGGREALAPPGATWGTTDPEVAEALFDARLAELKAKRKHRVGVPQQRTTTLAELVRDHLLLKAKAGKTSDSHLLDLEHRLTAALDYFGRDRDPRTIEPQEIGAWAEHLAKDGRRKPGTCRHYLNSLSGLYRRAEEQLCVDARYNPVVALVEKPTGGRTTEAEFFEVAEAALVLEAARVLDARERGRVGVAGNTVNATPGLCPIVAVFLLTGGRRREVLGLDINDVSFDRNLVRFRPNKHRGLKTVTSRRTVPLWPQLREILQEWLYGGDHPLTSGLLFPGLHGGRVRGLRKRMATIAELCGLEPGELYTRRLRHSYCSARLQTVERIIKPGKVATDEDAWDYVEVSRDRVAREMGHGGTKLVERIYGHAPRLPYRSEEVAYRVEQHREQLGERLAVLKAAR